MASVKGRLLAGLLLFGALVAVLGCGNDKGSGSVPMGTPVILISVDTLRADRLPAYGYTKVATPAIDRLRRDSILFDRAYAPVPLTFPSHVTAFTGLLPSAHRVRDNMGYRLDTDGIPYLPRDLKALGYATGAAVSTFVLRGASGLSDSFDLYDDRLIFTEWTDVGSVQRKGHETLERSVPWLRSVANKPFFFFFHIYEPHTPHRPPEPYASRYPSPYDAEVALADEIVGLFLGELEELGVYDRAIILFLSDHGEGLGEHGHYEHGPLIYREVLQVPLMLKLPKSKRGGTSISASVQLADIYPTVMSLLGQPLPPELAGDSLLSLEGLGERGIYSETVFPRVHFGWSDLASLIEYPYHYIHGPDPELYDLEADPGELENILRRERRLASRLAEQLESFDRSLEGPSEEDPETLRKLAALGYLGSNPVEADGPLPDPKARLFVLDLMREALDYSAERQWEKAEVAYREVLAEEPGMVDAWEKLGFALLETGRDDESVAAFEEAMRLSNGAPQIALSMADVFLRLDRLEEARVHAEIALETHELARDVLAQVALRQGDIEGAAKIAEEAVAARGARLAPLVTLADLRLKEQRYQEAIDLSQDVLDEFGNRQDRDKLRGLYFIRGQAFVQLGRTEEARQAFEREIEVSPDQLASYTHLAYLHALEGRGPEAGATLQRMVETHPTPTAYAEAVRALRAMGDAGSADGLLRMARGRWPNDQKLAELGR